MKEKTKEKIVKTGEILLSVIGAAGIVTVASVFPNALKMLGDLGVIDAKLKRREYELSPSMGRLLKNGLVKIKNENKNKYLELTQKGQKVLFKYQLEGLSKNKPKKWDKKYRLVIFDIQEKRRAIRDELRRVLNKFGFFYLQNSVWVYPYHCQEIIDLLKTNLLLEKEVIYMTVDSIENDKWLRTIFSLK